MKDCALSGSTAGSGYGLYLGNVSDVTVKACDLYSNAIGMRIDLGSTRVYVRDCNARHRVRWIHVGDLDCELACEDIAVTNTTGYNDQTTPLSSTPPARRIARRHLRLLRPNGLLRNPLQRDAR